jgi:hypothetical protein
VVVLLLITRIKHLLLRTKGVFHKKLPLVAPSVIVFQE